MKAIFHRSAAGFIDLPTAAQGNDDFFEGAEVDLLDASSAAESGDFSEEGCMWATFPDGKNRLVWPEEVTT